MGRVRIPQEMYKHCPGAAIQVVYLRSQGVFLGWTDGFVEYVLELLGGSSHLATNG